MDIFGATRRINVRPVGNGEASMTGLESAQHSVYSSSVEVALQPLCNLLPEDGRVFGRMACSGGSVRLRRAYSVHDARTSYPRAVRPEQQEAAVALSE